MNFYQKELVQTTARGWRNGLISQTAPAHGKCKKCGANIWWGSVQFKGSDKPSWIAYSHAGHGGNGEAVMEKHDCNNPLHKADQ